MMVAFDSNALLDAIANRAHEKEVQQRIMAAAQERLEGVITANSLTDIYYIVRKMGATI